MSQKNASLLDEAREYDEQYGEEDLTNPTSGGGGGDYVPPAEGPTRTRLVGYIETGIHTTTSTHGEKTKPRVQLIFELSGPKHEPKVLEDGTKIAQKITVKEIKGTHVKNGYIKLFNQLNYNGTAKSYLDLLLEGGGWRATVSHYKFKKGDKEVVIAQLKNNGAYTFASPEFEDPETGDLRKVAIPPALSDLRLFRWDKPTLAQWDSIFVKGDRNPWQTLIRQAENFEGSPIQQLLIEAGRNDEARPLAANETAGTAEEGDEGEEGVAETQQEAKPEPAKEAPKAAAKPAAKAAPAKAPAKAPKTAQETRKPAAKGKVATDDSDPLAGV